ncbi:MAG: hypothetical protein K9M10_00770 [Candidatus Pacebacteria bacterium]|nr:hypothetical protein [Candidatus Paceibacterota bacterium]MCF7856995.1 hypothetical protein [Candidatus Paceibacterota bacterium]
MKTSQLREPAIKIIAIIGFLTTIFFLVWLAAEGIKRAPHAFSSLASIAQNISQYRPSEDFSLSTEKSVVNSDESFQVTWTDLKEPGEYHFSYTCTNGVDLLVRSAEGDLVPVSCTDVLSLPSTVNGLFLSVNSDELRFSDIPLKVRFTNEVGSTTVTGETKVTVVNAAIPTGESLAMEELDTKLTTDETTVTIPEGEIMEPEAAVVAVQKPAATTPVFTQKIIYPQSNPNGYSDLQVKMIGSGILKNNVFVYTPTYNYDLKNAIKFDIRNIGTKTSSTWTFSIVLPGGGIYKSDPQVALKPQEHVEFTLGFTIDDSVKKDFVRIPTTVYSSQDVNKNNNMSVWHVALQD